MLYKTGLQALSRLTKWVQKPKVLHYTDQAWSLNITFLFSIKAWGPLSIQNGLLELKNLLKKPLGSFKLIGLEGYAQASGRRNAKAIQPTKREKKSNQMLGSFLTN